MTEPVPDADPDPPAARPIGGRGDRVAALLLAVLGGAATWWAMPRGVRLYSDSAAYLEMARRFEHQPWRFFSPGRGPVVDELNHWAPLTGLAIAGIGVMGPGPVDAGELMAVVLGAAAPALMFWVLRPAAGRATSIVAAVALLVSFDFLQIVGSLASEGLFACLMLAIGSLVRAVERDARRWYAAAALAAFGAATTRAIGATLVLTVVVVAAAQPRSRRGRALGTTLVAGVLPTAVWAAAYGSDRDVGFHPPLGRVNELLLTLARWTLPDALLDTRVGRVIGAAVALATAGSIAGWLIGRIRARGAADPNAPLNTVVVTTAVVYTLGLLASQTLLDDEVPLNSRILLPVLICVVIGLAANWPRPLGTQRPRFALAAAAAVTVVLLVQAAQAVVRRDDYSLSYSAEEYTGSPTLAAVARLPRRAVVYSNARAALLLLADRNTERISWTDGGAQDRARLRAAVSRLRATGGVVVFLDIEASRSDLPPRSVLESTPGLRIDRTLSDGVVFRAN